MQQDYENIIDIMQLYTGTEIVLMTDNFNDRTIHTYIFRIKILVSNQDHALQKNIKCYGYNKQIDHDCT